MPLREGVLHVTNGRQTPVRDEKPGKWNLIISVRKTVRSYWRFKRTPNNISQDSFHKDNQVSLAYVSGPGFCSNHRSTNLNCT